MFRQLLTVMALGCVVLMLAPAGAARATTILVDDFNDGNDDGWTRDDETTGDPWGPGAFDASSLSYHFLGGGPVPTGSTGALTSWWDTSSDPSFSNGLLRATIRANNVTAITSLIMRGTPGPGPNPAAEQWYLFGGNPRSGNLWYNKWDGHLTGDVFSPDEPFLSGDDWDIEAGAVGNQLSMKVWKVGEQEPAAPQWTFTDPSPLGPGLIGLGAWHKPSHAPDIVDATFDDVYFTPIPEPSTSVLLLLGIAFAVSAVRRRRGC